MGWLCVAMSQWSLGRFSAPANKSFGNWAKAQPHELVLQWLGEELAWVYGSWSNGATLETAWVSLFCLSRWYSHVPASSVWADGFGLSPMGTQPSYFLPHLWQQYGHGCVVLPTSHESWLVGIPDSSAAWTLGWKQIGDQLSELDKFIFLQGHLEYRGDWALCHCTDMLWPVLWQPSPTWGWTFTIPIFIS